MLTKSIEYSLCNISNCLNLSEEELDYVRQADETLINFVKNASDILFFGVDVDEIDKVVAVRNFFVDIGNEEQCAVWGVEVTLSSGTKLSKLLSTDSIVKISVKEYGQAIYEHVVKQSL